MKKIYYLPIALAFALTGCADDDTMYEDAVFSTTYSSFNASIADMGTTRTYLENNSQVVWDENDAIGIYSDEQGIGKYTYDSSSFSGDKMSGNKFYAFYPYSKDAGNSSSVSVVSLSLASTTSYKKGSYYRELPMVAASTNNNLSFKQTCGILSITLYGTSKINSLQLQANGGELITGQGTVDISASSPVLQMVDDNSTTDRTVLSMSANGVQLSESEPTCFYFILPVGTYREGLTLTVDGTNAQGKSFTTEKQTGELTVKRAVIAAFSGLDLDEELEKDDETGDTNDEKENNNENVTSNDGTASVLVTFSNSSATISASSDVANYITVKKSGAHVSITQSTDLATEITYTLSGSSPDGEFYMDGSYKATVELNGLTLTNVTPLYSGAAIHIQNGKRINIKVVEGTTNTLTDSSSGSQKGALYIKGHAEFKQKGTLNIYGNLKHGIKTGEYMTVKNATINIKSAVGDGINVSEFFLMESGNISISGVGDDGIQSDIDGTASTGETTDHEDEDSGNIYLQGGTITATITAAASKGIKAEGDMIITDGTYTVKTTGNGAYDSDDNDAKGCAGLKADGNISVSGGSLNLSSSGSGGKCIKADGKLNITGGNIDAQSTGSKYTYSSRITASPKCIKSDGAMSISGGYVSADSKNHEAIESKNTLDITGGYVYACSSDDAINSASHLTINGGYVMANSSGNDGIDANGNLYVKGGNIVAVVAGSPEVALDANTEGGCKLYITGGNMVAIGGLENGASVSGGSAYQASSYSKGTWYALYNSGSTPAFAFKVPSNNSMGTPMVVYTTGTTSLKSGVTGSGTSFWSGNGYSSCSGGSSVSLSSYSGGNGGGMPSGNQLGGGPGGNNGGRP